MHIPDITSKFGVNPVAAMPSLHAAFPFLSAILLFRSFKWKSWPFSLYSMGVFFTIVYTGDHYIVDIIAGFIVSGFALLATLKITDLLQKKQIIKRSSLTNLSKIKKKSVIVGLIILAIGISLGMKVDKSFQQNSDYLDIEAAYPYYKDFFDNIDFYKDNFKINLTYGNHLFSHKQFKKALYYYQKAFSLHRNLKEKMIAVYKIRMCKAIIK